MTLNDTKKIPVRLIKDARLKLLGKYYESKSKKTYNLEMQFLILKTKKENHSTSLFNLCADVVNHIISPFLQIQSYTVYWTYITISVITQTLGKPFYSRLPLTRLHGRKTQEPMLNKSLDIRVQYLESRQTNKLKVYGVISDMFFMSDANYEAQKNLLSNCEGILIEEIHLKESNVTVKYVKSVPKTDVDAKPKMPIIVTV